MSEIKLQINEDGYVENCTFSEDVTMTFDGAVSFCLAFLESSVKQYLKDKPEDAEGLYDTIDALFFKFMERAFPDIQPRDFDLSDAGLLYAQDQIIKRAAKKGITYEEALAEYEKKAKKYVNERAKIMIS